LLVGTMISGSLQHIEPHVTMGGAAYGIDHWTATDSGMAARQI